MAVTGRTVKVVTRNQPELKKDNSQVTILKSRPTPPSPTTNTDFDWKPWATAFGGGLLMHTLASSLMNNKTDEEKRRESIWERLLSAVIPLGIGGLGMYGGYRLGQSMNKSGEATNDFMVVTAPNGKELAVPYNDADNIDAILQYLDDNPDTPVDLDTAYQKLLEARKDDKKGWGSFVNPSETVTTWLQPTMYGIGLGAGAKAGWEDFSSGFNKLYEVNRIKQSIKNNNAAILNWPNQLRDFKSQSQEVQQKLALKHGYKTFAEMEANHPARLANRSLELSRVEPTLRGERAKGVGSIIKGVAKGGAKAWPWMLGGVATGVADSWLENAQDEQTKQKNLAEYAKNNIQRIQQTLDNSEKINDPEGMTE